MVTLIVTIQKFLETYLMILVSIKDHTKNLETYLMILVSIKVPILKKSGILFYDPRILAHRKKVRKLI